MAIMRTVKTLWKIEGSSGVFGDLSWRLSSRIAYAV
jgi:hypothetical protein